MVVHKLDHSYITYQAGDCCLLEGIEDKRVLLGSSATLEDGFLESP